MSGNLSGDSLIDESRRLLHLGDFAQAVAASYRALDLFAQQGDTAGEARALDNLGIALNRLGRLDGALDCHMHAEVLFARIGDRKLELGATLNRGNVLHGRGDLDAAKECFRRCRDGSRVMGDRDGEAVALHNLGNVALAEGATGDAVVFYEDSLRVSSRPVDERGASSGKEALCREAETRMMLCVALRHAGDYRRAESECLKSLGSAIALGEQHLAAQAATNLGNVFFKQNRLSEAASAYEQSLELKLAIGDRLGARTTCDNLVMTLEELRDFSRLARAIALQRELRR